MYPGTQAKGKVRLDTLYDLSAPGSYLIYFKYRVYREDGTGEEELRSANATINIIGSTKTAGQVNPGNTTATTASSSGVPSYQGMAAIVGKKSSAYSPPSVSGTEPKSTANTPQNILHPTPKAAANKTPAQLAQAETGAGWSGRDKVYGLLVLGLLLGLGWYLFRARSPDPRS